MKNLKTKVLALFIFIALSAAAGCSEDAQFKANNNAAFKACIESGGVPMQAWFNEKVLGDCVYKPAL